MLYICVMRVDGDLIGSAVAGGIAAAAVIGTLHLQPALAVLLGVVILVGAGVVFRRHRSFHEPLRPLVRQAVIEFVVLAAIAIAIDEVLVNTVKHPLLSGILSAAVVGLLSAYRIAERWWRVPIGTGTKPRSGGGLVGGGTVRGETRKQGPSLSRAIEVAPACRRLDVHQSRQNWPAWLCGSARGHVEGRAQQFPQNRPGHLCKAREVPAPRVGKGPEVRARDRIAREPYGSPLPAAVKPLQR